MVGIKGFTVSYSLSSSKTKIPISTNVKAIKIFANLIYKSQRNSIGINLF